MRLLRVVLEPPDGGVGVREVVGFHEVVAGEVLVGGEDAVQVLAGNIHEPGEPRAGADEDRVVAVLLHELGDRPDLADDVVHLELDTELRQVVHLALHDRLGETELGNAVDEHAASLVQRLEDGHLVTGLDAVARHSEPGGSGADDGDLLAGLRGRLGHRRLTLLRLPVGDEALETADRHRLLLLSEDADLLALVLLGTDAAADGGQKVGLLDRRHRSGHVLIGDRLDECRNIYGDGAAPDAEGLLAHQAARGLYGSLLDGVAEGHGIEVLRPHMGVLLRHGGAGELGPLRLSGPRFFLFLVVSHISSSSLHEGWFL